MTNSALNHLSPEVREALQRDLTIDITTIGRRSGEPRRIEIWFIRVDGDFYIIGTPGPRDWLANLRAHPQFTVHLKESVQADLAAVAIPVDDPTERRKVAASMAAEWYQGQADLAELVARSPMVRFSFPAA